MGVSPKLARSAVRFSLSAETTHQEIATVLLSMEQILSDLRARLQILPWAGSDDDD